MLGGVEITAKTRAHARSCYGSTAAVWTLSARLTPEASGANYARGLAVADELALDRAWSRVPAWQRAS